MLHCCNMWPYPQQLLQPGAKEKQDNVKKGLFSMELPYNQPAPHMHNLHEPS